jgi:hypothetical protein
VETIERGKNLYDQYSPELARINGVTPHWGDSRDVLPQIVGRLGGRRAVYWLDGHWSAGATAGEHDECPLLAELSCLANRTEDIILIDDARLFLCAPPPPHDPAQWPTIPDIVNALPASGRRQLMQIVDDVIFIVPDDERLKGALLDYAQRRGGMLSQELGRFRQSQVSLTTRVKGRLSRIRRGMRRKH